MKGNVADIRTHWKGTATKSLQNSRRSDRRISGMGWEPRKKSQDIYKK